MQKLQCAVSNWVSHLIVILIYPNGFQVWACKYWSDSFTGVRPLIVPLDRTLRLLSARSPIHWECIIRPDKRVKRPLWHLKQCPALVLVTRKIWMKQVGSDAWTAWVGRGFCDCKRDFTGAGYVIQERRSQLKPSTVDDVPFFSNLKHQAKPHIV